MSRNSAALSKGDRTRQRALGQAAKLFARHGYEGVSMERLARALKLTKGALYTHFRGKNEIYIESIVDYVDRRNQTRPVADADASAEQNLERYLVWLLEIFEQDKTYRLLLVRLFIDADVRTTHVIAQRILEPPVIHLTRLIHAYRPDINALEFVYSLSSIAMLNPDVKKTLAVFDQTPERQTGSLLRHMMHMVEAV
jgi:AcrR family transcriptional regulator